MCYMPNLRDRACRFGPTIAERKLVRRCVFCERRVPHNLHWYTRWWKLNRCPKLTTPGHVIVEPGQELNRVFEYHGLTVGQDYQGRVAEVWVPEPIPNEVTE